MPEKPYRIDYTDPTMVRVVKEAAEDSGIPLLELLARTEFLSKHVEIVPGNDSPETA